MSSAGPNKIAKDSVFGRKIEQNRIRILSYCEVRFVESRRDNNYRGEILSV